MNFIHLWDGCTACLITYLGKLFAIFLLFQLLPVPVNLNVLLVRLNDFILDFVGSLLLVLLLSGAAVFVPLLSLDFDTDDLLLSRLTLLLQLTCMSKTLLVQDSRC